MSVPIVSLSLSPWPLRIQLPATSPATVPAERSRWQLLESMRMVLTTMMMILLLMMMTRTMMLMMMVTVMVMMVVTMMRG